MDRIKIEGINEEEIPKDHPSEFYLRSLDIDIICYGTILKKLAKV
ncbi:MAG: hypothetical protein QG646_1817 [Euryarchaeota archaeon]|nr:hypothetical protein [Euryarchaeota archaeon]